MKNATSILKKYKEIWIPLVCFCFIILLLSINQVLPIDLWIYKKLSFLIQDSFTEIVKKITFFGNTNTIIVLSITWATYLTLKDKKELQPFALILLLSLLCIVLLKPIFARERPDILRLIPIDGYSFPSGHSIISASFYGYLTTYFLEHKRKLVASICFLFIIGIGFSRIYLGVHYFSDVLAGYSVGTAVLGTGNLLRRKDKAL